MSFCMHASCVAGLSFVAVYEHGLCMLPCRQAPVKSSLREARASGCHKQAQTAVSTWVQIEPLAGVTITSLKRHRLSRSVFAQIAKDCGNPARACLPNILVLLCVRWMGHAACLAPGLTHLT